MDSIFLLARSRMFMITGGRICPVAGGDLARFIGYPNADFGVLDYLVLNHLAVIFRSDAQSIDISLNAVDFDRANLEAMREHLIRHGAGRPIRMRSFLGNWLLENFADHQKAIERLRQICDGELRAPSNARRRALQDPSSLCVATAAFSAPADRPDGVSDSDFTGAAEGESLLARTYAAAVDGDGQWTVRFTGREIDALGTWRPQSTSSQLASIANDHDDIPWCAEREGDAHASPNERLDHLVLVAISRARFNRLRNRSHRIPFVSLDGHPLVVDCSVSSGDLVLPL